MNAIAEYSTKDDQETGLRLIRYCGKWCPWVHLWLWDGSARVAAIGDKSIDLPTDPKTHAIILPNGKRTKNYYH